MAGSKNKKSTSTNIFGDAVPQSNHISALDANPRSGGGAPPQTGPYYADDDSVVSSNVTQDDIVLIPSNDSDDGNNAEIAMLTGQAETDIENATEPPTPRGKRWIMPRNAPTTSLPCSGKSCGRLTVGCAICLIIAAGVGIGLGFYFAGKNKDSGNVQNPGGNKGRPEKNNITIPDDDHNATSEDETSWPTYSPSSSPIISAPTPTGPTKPDPDDLASSIEYHVIAQEISDIASFSALADGANNGVLTPQDKARDFLVLRDFLPLTVMDEDEDGGTDSNGGNDDVVSIPSNEDPKQRKPYLTTETPAYRVAQRYALAVLYYATNGDNWDSNRFWLDPGVHECEFVGVSCEDLPIPSVTLKEALESPDEVPEHNDGSADLTRELMVTAIDLPENNMRGTLPQELMAMPLLRRLGLWSNRIGGSLPTQLGMLSRLSSLHLDDNRFEGNIPSELGELSQLTNLFLDRNELITGRIPTEIGNLSELERLRLSNLSLRGAIPTTLGKLTNLVDMSLENNKLGRRLPEEMKNLVQLETLKLSNNQFTGGIPMSWRSLIKLKTLDLQANKMSFDLDERFCALRKDWSPEGDGLLEALLTDCQGDEPRVLCSCCTNCP
eukprot:CAMPEP_0183715938 /NCGR_PEP_ID=MMETSP0737-20130205/9980_1 /TAXON_ID=385413 /ORGANISM="Thalassiosira miniscula, Strain CCMP1093" /LENGTH=609 /DNA_ID=CAMNT_0025945115 /DNA_START=70 /DNA_END=1899 /DNA_ORIENTATION=+